LAASYFDVLVEEDVMLSRLDGFRPGLFAGTYVVAGALFAGDGVQKLLTALDGSAVAMVGVSGAVEVLAGVLVAAASRLALRQPRGRTA
jgi:hypothetical protein